jgi:hypothetical protein
MLRRYRRAGDDANTHVLERLCRPRRVAAGRLRHRVRLRPHDGRRYRGARHRDPLPLVARQRFDLLPEVL